MIFDGHSDIWTDVVVKMNQGEKDIIRKYHIDRLKKGKIAGMILVIWIDPPYTLDPLKRMTEIEKAIQEEIQCCQDELVIVRSFEEMQEAISKNKIYAFIGMEGLSGIGKDLGLINHYYDFGARHVGLTWNEENDLATGITGNPDRGLTHLGIQAVKIINEKGMLLDVSHLNDRSFWDLAGHTAAPIIASHSNCRALCDVPRNLTDEQIKKIGELGGLVGVNAFNEFVSRDREKQTLETLAIHAAHMADLIGPEHVAIGMDYCEFIDHDTLSSFSSGDTYYTKGLEDASKTPDFLLELERLGFSKSEIEGIAYKNYHRIIKQIIG